MPGKNTHWVDFKYKKPFSNVTNRQCPYDFPIIVALAGHPIHYAVMSAKEATEFFDPERFIAWMPVIEYQ